MKVCPGGRRSHVPPDTGDFHRCWRIKRYRGGRGNRIFGSSHSPKDIAEKLEILIQIPQLRKEMGSKGYDRAKMEYRTESYVGKVDQLYQELLREKGLL